MVTIGPPLGPVVYFTLSFRLPFIWHWLDSPVSDILYNWRAGEQLFIYSQRFIWPCLSPTSSWVRRPYFWIVMRRTKKWRPPDPKVDGANMYILASLTAPLYKRSNLFDHSSCLFVRSFCCRRLPMLLSSHIPTSSWFVIPLSVWSTAEAFSSRRFLFLRSANTTYHEI